MTSEKSSNKGKGKALDNDQITIWKMNLSRALSEWMTSEDYEITALATELDINPSTMRRIVKGDTVSLEAENYARVFVRTGLQEADPRTIPTRRVNAFHGRTAPKETAWSDEVFQAWLRSKEHTYSMQERVPEMKKSPAPRKTASPKRKEVPPQIDELVSPQGSTTYHQKEERAQAPPGLPGFKEEVMRLLLQHSSKTIVDMFIEPFIALLSPQVGSMIHDEFSRTLLPTISTLEIMCIEEFIKIREDLDQLKYSQEEIREDVRAAYPKPTASVIKAVSSRTQEFTPGTLALKLVDLIEPSLRMSVEDRDSLVNKYGHEFGRLLPLIDAFTKNPEDREKILRLTGLIKE